MGNLHVDKISVCCVDLKMYFHFRLLWCWELLPTQMCQLLSVHGARLWVPLCSRPWVSCLQHELWVRALLLRPRLSNRVLWTWQLWQPDLSLCSWLQRQPLWKSGLSRYFSFTLIFSLQNVKWLAFYGIHLDKKKVMLLIIRKKGVPILLINGKEDWACVLLSFFDWLND